MTVPPDDPEAPRGPFLYFGYGSSLDIARLHLHCPSARLVTIARRVGVRLAFSIESKRTWLGGVANMLPAPADGAAPADEVWGALYLIDAAESRLLDEQEGLFRDPPAYRREAVEVMTPAGDVVRCRSYVVADPNIEGFLPSPAFKATLLRGARALGLPRTYVAHLEALVDNGVPGGGAPQP